MNYLNEFIEQNRIEIRISMMAVDTSEMILRDENEFKTFVKLNNGSMTKKMSILHIQHI